MLTLGKFWESIVPFLASRQIQSIHLYHSPACDTRKLEYTDPHFR